jgi:nitrogen regulatory protein P-II 1
VLQLVTAIIKPHQVIAVKEALQAHGVHGLTVSEVKGFGRQGGHTETYRGAEYSIDFVPKVKIELVVPEDQAVAMSEVIANAARTGKIGDGKLWITNLVDVLRIRTGERGVDAV